MKTSLKKSLLLLGMAFVFVLSAQAYFILPFSFDKSVPPDSCCLNGGTLVILSETSTTFYGYCYCTIGYWGERCELEED